MMDVDNVLLQIPQVQTKCRLLHKNGLAFDFIVAATFNLDIVVTQVRANGFLLVSGQCYIPESEIGMIFMLQGEHPDKPAQIINFPEQKL